MDAELETLAREASVPGVAPEVRIRASAAFLRAWIQAPSCVFRLNDIIRQHHCGGAIPGTDTYGPWICRVGGFRKADRFQQGVIALAVHNNVDYSGCGKDPVELVTPVEWVVPSQRPAAVT